MANYSLLSSNMIYSLLSLLTFVNYSLLSITHVVTYILIYFKIIYKFENRLFTTIGHSHVRLAVF
jgi:hypothetical protein